MITPIVAHYECGNRRYSDRFMSGIDPVFVEMASGLYRKRTRTSLISGSNLVDDRAQHGRERIRTSSMFEPIITHGNGLHLTLAKSG